ncbi:unnamed protein product, partial [Meganyctiphanes norvegica]
RFKMRRVCIFLIMAASITKIDCDGDHSPAAPPHKHIEDRGGGSSPDSAAKPSSNSGFDFNYFFLWHSDATILNYLARDGGKADGSGGQAARAHASPAPGTGTNGGGHHGTEEEDHFGKYKSLFRVLAQV